MAEAWDSSEDAGGSLLRSAMYSPRTLTIGTRTPEALRHLPSDWVTLHESSDFHTSTVKHGGRAGRDGNHSLVLLAMREFLARGGCRGGRRGSTRSRASRDLAWNTALCIQVRRIGQRHRVHHHDHWHMDEIGRLRSHPAPVCQLSRNTRGELTQSWPRETVPLSSNRVRRRLYILARERGSPPFHDSSLRLHRTGIC